MDTLLTNIYDLIEEAESHMRENSLTKSIKSYQAAQSELEKLGSNAELESDIREALILLKKDIFSRIRELELLQDASENGSTINSSDILLPRMTDMTGFSVGNGTVLTDPLLVSITNRLENNLLSFMNSHNTNKTINSEISQQINQLRRELCFYEQRKFKEYDLKLEQVMQENKKLFNQVVHLKERWDGLVESAKLKRNPKHS